MTLGEKLSKLRKENNMTQEQLADTLGVSRQSISKWESDVAYPETDKLIHMSEMFRCSLDYLLKDGVEKTQLSDEVWDRRRLVTMEEAIRFLDVKRKATMPTAIATLLCILSPIGLFILGALSETKNSGVSENMAGGLGMIILLFMVAIAAVIFIMAGKHSDEFEYLEKEQIRVMSDVTAFAREKKNIFRAAYTKGNIAGTLLCILSTIPLFCGIMLFENDDFMMVTMLCLMFVLIGIGVVCFIRVGIPWASLDKLLQEGDYSPERKARGSVIRVISLSYWLCATAVYLLYSFMTDAWHISWIVWAVAGVLFPAVLSVCNIFIDRK